MKKSKMMDILTDDNYCIMALRQARQHLKELTVYNEHCIEIHVSCMFAWQLSKGFLYETNQEDTFDKMKKGGCRIFGRPIIVNLLLPGVQFVFKYKV